MMRTSDVKFEKLSIEDKEEYADFLIDAYKDQFNSYQFKDREKVKKIWFWKYVDNPALAKGNPLIWIARIGGKIAGQLCLMPVEIKIGDNMYKAGWTQDFIILPQHRHKGIGRLLVGYVIEDSKKYLDMLLVAGTNKASYTIFKQLDFIDVDFISRNIKIMDFRNMPNRLSNNIITRVFIRAATYLSALISFFYASVPNNKKIDIAELDRFGESIDTFWLAVSKVFPNIVKRDSECLKRRFIEQPFFKYKILTARDGRGVKGYVIIRIGEINNGRFSGLKMGIVSDILFDPEERYIGKLLLKAAIGYFDGRTDMMRCDILDRKMRSVIMSSGFIGIKSNNRFLLLPLTDELKSRYANPSETTNAHWHITYSDSDLDLS